MATPPAQPVPGPGWLHYQFEEFGKCALGVLALQPLVSRFVVGSSAPVAKSRLLPLGSLQERSTAPVKARNRGPEGAVPSTGLSQRWPGLGQGSVMSYPNAFI